MIKFDKLEEIYKDKKRNAILLMIGILLFALDVALFVISIVRGNTWRIALNGVLVGMVAFTIIGLVITQVAINKKYKEEQAKIELETFLESQKILMSAFEQIDKELKEKRKLAKEKAEQEKAKVGTEKPKAKKKAEPKAKAETKTTKKKN